MVAPWWRCWTCGAGGDVVVVSSWWCRVGVSGVGTAGDAARTLIYHQSITSITKSTQAYDRVRRMIVRLDYAPGDLLRDDELQERLGIGRTPIREALQRLAREQFVTVVPRRGMFVSSIDIDDLTSLYETRSVVEPHAARLAAVRGTARTWDEMARVIDGSLHTDSGAEQLLDVDRRCHEIIWRAAGNRFLTDTLDALYAQSDRVWHLYLADLYDTRHAVDEHVEMLEAFRRGDPDECGALMAAHLRGFDDQVRAAVTARLGPPRRSSGSDGAQTSDR